MYICRYMCIYIYSCTYIKISKHVDIIETCRDMSISDVFSYLSEKTNTTKQFCQSRQTLSYSALVNFQQQQQQQQDIEYMHAYEDIQHVPQYSI